MDALAAVLERVAATNSRARKIALLSDHLAQLPPADAALAVQFLRGVPVAGAKLAIGGTILRDAVAAASGWDTELVRLCLREVGDTGEAISLLLTRRTAERPLSLAGASAIYQRLAMARRTALKLAILAETFQTYRPLALRYFVKCITGNLRIGLQEKMVREAAERAGLRLASLEPAVFEPLEFMLAKPLEQAPAIADPAEWHVEDKYDGIRAQVHFRRGEVRIFTRGMEEATAAFPEIVSAAAQLPGDGILDGEILAWREDRALAFAVLQQRIARKKVSPETIEKAPVRFIAYDILWRDGNLLRDASLEARRAALEQVWPHVSPQRRLPSTAAIETEFAAARARGNEGLILKRAGSVYEAGKRSGTWIKVKRPYGTLDVVVTAAEQGHGKRATVLSDYTFAVRDGDRFLNVGKAYSGLTDEEIRELTRIFRALATERFGRVTLVRPEVVMEVAFDGVQKSPRHKSGYALRFPRILRWRRDKTAAEIDGIEQVKALYEASLAS
jgi:DNA ligase-1